MAGFSAPPTHYCRLLRLLRSNCTSANHPPCPPGLHRCPYTFHHSLWDVLCRRTRSVGIFFYVKLGLPIRPHQSSSLNPSLAQYPNSRHQYIRLLSHQQTTTKKDQHLSLVSRLSGISQGYCNQTTHSNSKRELPSPHAHLVCVLPPHRRQQKSSSPTTRRRWKYIHTRRPLVISETGQYRTWGEARGIGATLQA